MPLDRQLDSTVARRIFHVRAPSAELIINLRGIPFQYHNNLHMKIATSVTNLHAKFILALFTDDNRWPLKSQKLFLYLHTKKADQKIFSISHVFEDCLSFNAASDNIVRRTRSVHARFVWHIFYKDSKWLCIRRTNLQ